jgi:hypothetical protein
MYKLNSHFLRPSPTRSRDVSGDRQSALVVKLGVSPSRSRLLIGPHHYHPGIVQQAQGRSPETVVSPHHNNQSKPQLWLSNSVTPEPVGSSPYLQQPATDHSALAVSKFPNVYRTFAELTRMVPILNHMNPLHSLPISFDGFSLPCVLDATPISSPLTLIFY